ncbi:hypothetical protein [Pantoea eucrina]|uniref:hypothetical protein n=1 Tax=Pantoea eucrina TaxID=472693 RepID=UPI00080F5448|nr:hypothetical protein [Pantoea eucrina]
MAVLTWQNVDGPRQGYGAPSIDNAIRTLNSGFTALQGVDKSFTDASNANFDNQKQQNTGAMINALAGISSIDDLNKHRDSGAFSADNLKAQFGGAFDYDKFNAALMARRGQIQVDADNQLKLNANTDFQAHAHELQEAAGLAGSNPDAFRAYMAKHDFGAGSAQALGQLMPYMEATRQDATTQRGQSLSYAGTMAGVAVDRDRLNMQKAEMQRKNTLDDADRAKKDTSGAYSLGQGAAQAALQAGSENDGLVGFHKSDAYLKLNSAQKTAADSAFDEQYNRGLQLTDAQQKEQLRVAGTPNAKQQETLSDLTTRYDEAQKLKNPLYSITTGLDKLQGKPATELIDIAAKGVNYDTPGEIAEFLNGIQQETGLPYPDIVSIMQNNVGPSLLKMKNWGRPGLVYDKDAVLKKAKQLKNYRLNGDEANARIERNNALYAPQQGMLKIKELSTELARLRANGKPTKEVEAKLAAQQQETNKLLGTLDARVTKDTLSVPGGPNQAQIGAVPGNAQMVDGLLWQRMLMGGG